MIKIKIDGQRAIKLNTPVIAADAVNFVYLEVEFSNDWDGLRKSYIFTNGTHSVQVESESNIVSVPVEVLKEGTLTVGIKGVRLNADASTVEVKATHAALEYEVCSSGTDKEVSNAENVTPDLAQQLRDMVSKATSITLTKGEGENSLETYNSSAYSDFSTALGNACGAGRKGYYICSVDTQKKVIYLCNTQVTPVVSDADNTDYNFISPKYDVGDEICIINGGHYMMCATVENVRFNAVSYKGDLGFSEFTASPNFDDYTLSVPSKPDVGIVVLGESAFAAGEGNIAAGRSSFAAGRDNIAAGNFSAVYGRGNKAGYACHVSGFGNTVMGNGAYGEGYHNKVNGNQSHTEGHNNNIKGDVVHAEGYQNSVNGSGNHVEGRANIINGQLNTVGGGENTVTGNLHDVSGQYNVVNGHRNTVRGENNIASGWTQFVTGKYSVDDSDKAFIVGYGSSVNDRKNIMTVDRQGNAYFAGTLSSPTIDELVDDYLYTFDNYRMVTRHIHSVSNAEISCLERSLEVKSINSDPFFSHSFKIPLDGTVYPYIKLRYLMDKQGITDTNSKIYFTTTSSGTVNEEKRVVFPITNDGQWHDIVVDMKKNALWDNSVKSLRFDIPNTSVANAVIYFKYIGLFHTLEEAQSFEVNA